MDPLKITESLINHQLITPQQLEQALLIQKTKPDKIGKILMDLGFISENDLFKNIATQLNVSFIELNNYPIDPNITKKIPEKIARKFKMLALAYTNEQYIVGIAEPDNILAIDELNKILGDNISINLINETSFNNIIDRIYRRTEDISSFAKELQNELGKEKSYSARSEENIAGDESSPVAKLMDSIFEDAVQVGSSDIHIEPENNLVRIRQRVDGVLQEHIIEGRQIANSLILRIKLLAKLNISEKRLPQDGRFVIKVKGKNLDVRAAIMPIRYGESAVLRLLDQSGGIIKINQLINRQDVLNRILFHIYRPSGLILLTGPTGSGKTTTLYSILSELNTPEKKIISIEDPIEYSLPRVTQIQVNSTIELTFAKILRTVLRQDPEIIMIGEMRDEETAQIGLRAAMTGHLVLATLHTNDAISSAIRLTDMGIANYLVAAALRAVIAQRLIRKICSSCIASKPITEEEKHILTDLIGGINPSWEFKKGSGCANCNNTGYKGRIAVQELLEMNYELSNILRTGDQEEFFKHCIKQPSFTPLVKSMLDCALNGTTTLEEMFRMAIESAEKNMVDPGAGTTTTSNSNINSKSAPIS